MRWILIVATTQRSLNDIIKTLGGPTKLAIALGVTTACVTNWRVRGIPRKRWASIEKLSRDISPDNPLSIADIEAASNLAAFDRS